MLASMQCAMFRRNGKYPENRTLIRTGMVRRFQNPRDTPEIRNVADQP